MLPKQSVRCRSTDGRDRDGSFEPQIVKKRERIWVDEIVPSLCASGRTTGEISRPTSLRSTARDMHALEDHDLVFDRDAVADRCAVLHEGSIANVAVTTDARACQDMRKRPDSGPVANLIALAQSARMHEDTVQWQRSRHRTTHQLLAVHPDVAVHRPTTPRNSLAARTILPPRAQLINCARKRDAEENDPELVSKSKQFGATASR